MLCWGRNAFWQFDIDSASQSCEARANSSCKGFLHLSVFGWKRRYLIHSNNLFLDILCENIAHPHDLPHRLFKSKLRPPLTSRATAKLMNFLLRKEPHPWSPVWLGPFSTVQFLYISEHGIIKNYSERCKRTTRNNSVGWIQCRPRMKLQNIVCMQVALSDR